MQEVKGHIEGLEKLEAQAVPSAYIFIAKTVKGLIHDIKLLNASFRSTAAKNHLLDCEGFKVDAQKVVDWHLLCNNKLVKLNVKGIIKVKIPSTGLVVSTEGNIIHNIFFPTTCIAE